MKFSDEGKISFGALYEELLLMQRVWEPLTWNTNVERPHRI
jgi:hypothetical protein